jgi:hypothetical protein
VTRVGVNAAACWGAAASLAIASAGVVIGCGLGHGARHRLGFEFGGVPRTPGEAIGIAVHNGWMAALALISAAIVPRVDAPARAFLDASLAMLLIVNATVVGITVGAYGGRAFTTLAPHAPIEFAALALGGGAYMHARKQAVPVATLAVTALLSASLLAAAALLETYVSSPGATL